MLPANYPTQEKLKKLVHYNPYTGAFTRIAGTNKGKAITSTQNGYIHFFVFGKKRAAHIMAWLYMTGELPDGMIDHRNRIRSDNRFINLRIATRIENMNNNASGIKYEKLPDVCVDDEIVSFYQACKILGVEYSMARNRYITHKCEPIEAIMVPADTVVGMNPKDSFLFKLKWYRMTQGTLK